MSPVMPNTKTGQATGRSSGQAPGHRDIFGDGACPAIGTILPLNIFDIGGCPDNSGGIGTASRLVASKPDLGQASE